MATDSAGVGHGLGDVGVEDLDYALSVVRIGTSVASGARPSMPSIGGPWPTITLAVEVP